jgi:hypothetical protein
MSVETESPERESPDVPPAAPETPTTPPAEEPTIPPAEEPTTPEPGGDDDESEETS